MTGLEWILFAAIFGGSLWYQYEEPEQYTITDIKITPMEEKKK